MYSVDEFLTADEIFSADDCRVVDVQVPEWTKNGKPGVIRFRQMNAVEAQKFMDVMQNPETRRRGAVQVVALTALAADGSPLFKNGEADVERLMSKNVGVFVRLQKQVLELNGLTPDGDEKTSAKND